MQIYMPTNVYSEDNCVMNHRKELAALGKKALIVTGKHSSRINGSLEDVEKALQEENIPFILFDSIEENPSIETVMEAGELGKREQVDFVVGIGGGSPMDAAKAIALMIANPAMDESILYKNEKLPALPVAEVPTTAGTGSEVTPYAILTIHARKTKQSISHKIYPDLALIDSRYLKTAGLDTLVDTAVDALAHLLESYLNTNANSYNRMYSEKGLSLFAEIREELLSCRRQGEKPAQTLSDRVFGTLMQLAATAGMAITHTGTSLPHGLSYTLTYEMQVPHGKAVGIFLPGFLKYYQNKDEVQFVLDQMGFASVEDFTEYLDELLGKVEIPEGLWIEDVKSIMANKAKLKNYPFEMDKTTLYAFRR
ncbi:MAG: iron-containing alcohol dehydrogenase [Lachnospiraceae bacterium]|nr:iron-containing alcohol dehydrogenase [Lachnospiraceae bacterium]